MKSVHAPFEAIRRTLDSQLDDFRERRVAAASAESHQEPPSETTSAENDTDGAVRSGPYLRSAVRADADAAVLAAGVGGEYGTPTYATAGWPARRSEVRPAATAPCAESRRRDQQNPCTSCRRSDGTTGSP